MRRSLGMLIDTKRCIGCNACTIACKAENHSPPGVVNTKIEEKIAGIFPRVGMHLSKKACMHCKDPICEKVCPSGAMARFEEGLVAHESNLCIGCGYCAFSCPFEVPGLVGAKAHKCTMCIERVGAGEQPACVETCPTSALFFGEQDSLNEHARKRLEQLLARHPKASIYDPQGVGGTSVRYLLYDEPPLFGLPSNPRVPTSVTIWQNLVKPYASWLIPLALLGSMVSFVTTRLAKRNLEEELEGESD